ncbi:MAG: efflux RND transporter periplasmic adaptor subunit [Pseudooceanicola sp.]
MKRSRDVEDVLSKGQTTRFGARALVLAVAVLAVLAAAYLVFWPRAQGVTFVTDVVRRSGITTTVVATGSVQPTNKVEISSELSGVVDKVLFDDNDSVSAGDVLVHLDTSKLEAAVSQAEAAVVAREAAVAEARAGLSELADTLERVSALWESGTTTRERLVAAESAHERGEATLARAEADVELARAELTVAQTNLARACICSPIDGVVLERSVEVGQIVAASFQAPILFTIAEDLSRMQLEADVDEADIGRVSVGDRADFTVYAFEDRVFPAVIRELGYMPKTVDGVVTYRAILSIDNEEMLLRPGMTATVEIVTDEVEDALVVPNAALRFAPPTDPGVEVPVSAAGEKVLWVLREGNPVPVAVRTGRTDDVVTEVVDGDLPEGAVVIVDAVTE